MIKNAIRLLGPALAQMNGAPETTLKAVANEMDASARPYLELQTFDRFVFVISVLERYTPRECAALLGSSPREVEQAQMRGLQRIAGGLRFLLGWRMVIWLREREPETESGLRFLRPGTNHAERNRRDALSGLRILRRKRCARERNDPEIRRINEKHRPKV